MLTCCFKNPYFVVLLQKPLLGYYWVTTIHVFDRRVLLQKLNTCLRSTKTCVVVRKNLHRPLYMYFYTWARRFSPFFGGRVLKYKQISTCRDSPGLLGRCPTPRRPRGSIYKRNGAWKVRLGCAWLRLWRSGSGAGTAGAAQ